MSKEDIGKIGLLTIYNEDGTLKCSFYAERLENTEIQYSKWESVPAKVYEAIRSVEGDIEPEYKEYIDWYDDFAYQFITDLDEDLLKELKDEQQRIKAIPYKHTIKGTIWDYDDKPILNKVFEIECHSTRDAWKWLYENHPEYFMGCGITGENGAWLADAVPSYYRNVYECDYNIECLEKIGEKNGWDTTKLEELKNVDFSLLGVREIENSNLLYWLDEKERVSKKNVDADYLITPSYLEDIDTEIERLINMEKEEKMFTFSQEDVPEIKSPVPNSHCDYSIDFVSTELGKQNKKWGNIALLFTSMNVDGLKKDDKLNERLAEIVNTCLNEINGAYICKNDKNDNDYHKNICDVYSEKGKLGSISVTIEPYRDKDKVR